MKPSEPNFNPSMVPPHRRRLRNFLLLKGFQLKYAAMFAGTALVLSLVLGGLLAKTSRDVVRQSQEAVAQGRRAVETGQQLVKESQKVSAVVGLSMVKTTDYADNPELSAAFERDNQALAADTLARQKDLVAQAAALAQNASALKSGQRFALLSIFGLLAVLVLALGVLGIIFTHKVAGPIYKMKRYLRRIKDGELVEPAPLRRGDDLRDFFDELCAAVKSLRAREKEDLAVLESALEELGSRNSSLREKLEARCEVKRRALME